MLVVAVSGAAVGTSAGFVNLLAFLAPALRTDLHLSHAAVGLIVSSYFGATGVASVAAGRFADRVGARLSVGVAVGLIAACSFAAATSRFYLVLVGSAVVAGAAYASVNAGTNIAVAATVPIRRRGLGLTMKTAGGPLFAACSALVAGAVTSFLSWRIVVAGLGILASAGCVATILVLPNTSMGHATRTHGTRLPTGFMWFPVAAFFFILGAQPVFSWIVPFLEEDVGSRPPVAGAVTFGAIFVGVVGMLLSALRSDHAGVGRRVPILIGACLLCSCGEALIAASTHLGLAVAAAGAVVASAGLLSGTGVLHAALVDVAPEAVGRASGVTLTGFYLGALVSPVAFGATADGPGGYLAGWISCCVILILAAVAFARCLTVTGPQHHSAEARLPLDTIRSESG